MKTINFSKFTSWITAKLSKINPKDIQEGKKVKLIITLDNKTFLTKSVYKSKVKSIVDHIYKECLKVFNDGSSNANEGLDSFLDVYCYILTNQNTFKENKFFKIENNDFSPVYSKLGLVDSEDTSMTTVVKNTADTKDDNLTFYIMISDFDFSKSDKFSFLSLFKAITNQNRMFYFVLIPESSLTTKEDKLATLKILDKRPINKTTFISFDNMKTNNK